MQFQGSSTEFCRDRGEKVRKNISQIMLLKDNITPQFVIVLEFMRVSRKPLLTLIRIIGSKKLYSLEISKVFKENII